MDEAETLCIGQNISEYGLPVVWNGEYLISSVNGNDFNEDLIHIRYPWVQYYLTAMIHFFAGQNVLIYKICFVLLGLGSAYFLYKLAFSLTQDEKTSRFALWLYCLSITVISLIRCIRYYAPSLFFIMATLYMYNEFIRTKSKKSLALFILFSVLLFHSFHLFFICVMMTLLLVYLFFDRKRISYKYAGIAGISISAATLPFLGYYLYFNFAISNIPVLGQSGNKAGERLSVLFLLFNSYIAPIILIGATVAIILIIHKIIKTKKGVPFYIFNDENVKRTVFLNACLFIVNLLIVSFFTCDFSCSIYQYCSIV